MSWPKGSIWALIIAAAAAVIFTSRATYDPDLFWHLAQGRDALSGHIVRTNQYSAPAENYPQAYTSWGFEAAGAAITGADRLWALQMFEALLIAAALYALYISARVTASSTAAIAVLLLTVFVIEPRVMMRPYLVSWIGLALCALWIAQLMQRQRAPLWIVIVIAAWANLHSEAVLGAALIGLVGVSALLRPSPIARLLALRVIGIGALCVLATLATPYGIGMWRYLAENLFVPQVLRIAELQPPSLQTYPAFFALLAAIALLLAAQPSRLRLWECAVVIIFAAMGLRYIRFMPLIAFVAAPIVASRIDALIARGWDRRAVIITALALMAVTAPASPLRMARAWRVAAPALAPPDAFSAEAIAFASAHQLSGPLFNSMNLGGYISWMLPAARVFQDSRLQAYPPQHFASIMNAYGNAERWRELVDDVDWAMVSLSRPNELSGVGQFALEEWAPVFRDRAVEIWIRRSGRFSNVAREFEVKRGEVF